MRPGVYASVMRDRKPTPRRKSPTPHVYSWRRFFIMICVGALLFVPGLIVTIVGIESDEHFEDEQSDKVLYKFIGPAALALGVGLVCASGIYYCCWGFQSPVRRPHSKHKKTKKHGEQYDPLKTKSVPTISNHTTSPYTGGRGHGSPRRKCPRGNGDKVYNSPSTPDQRAARYNSNHHHPHHPAAVRAASMNSLGAGSVRSQHHHNSRHRSSSHSHHSRPTSSPIARITTSTTTTQIDNQVAFENTNAPLAQGESGSVDISIDIEEEALVTDKKY